MMKATYIIISSMFFSLLLVDYLLGNGLLNILLRFTSEMIIFVRRVIRDETNHLATENLTPINIPVLVSEFLFFAIFTLLLNRYGKMNNADRIDKLLLESKHRLQSSNEYLNRWRRRRILMEQSYLDEEPQPIAPLKLEVPILHMAIIDTRGTSRGSLRGDAGDAISEKESTLLSVTSLVDDDAASFGNDPMEDQTEEEEREIPLADNSNRYLWNVLEEDTDDLEMLTCYSE